MWWLFGGEECWVGGDVECEGKESWKKVGRKVGRKVGSTCKWEVVVVVFVVVGVDLFVFLPGTFMQCCDCLTCSVGVTSAACPDCLTG